MKAIKAIKAKRLTKSVGECSGRTTAAAASLSLSASPAAAPAQCPAEAGFITFPNGITVPVDLQVDPEPDEGEWERGRLVSVEEVWNVFVQQARQLFCKLWRQRQCAVATYIAQNLPDQTKWYDQRKGKRAPPNLAHPIGAISSSLWLTPSTPSFGRAPTFALPPAER